MYIFIGGKRFTKELMEEIEKVGKIDKKGYIRIYRDGKTAASFCLEVMDEETLIAHTMLSHQLGAGASVMLARVQIADRLGMKLYLEVSPFEFKNSKVKMLSADQLVRIYKRQGFEIIGVKNGKMQMMRKPRKLTA